VNVVVVAIVVIVAKTTIIFVLVLELISEMWATLAILATNLTISLTQQNTSF
jgi:hypothetical protein